MFVINKEDEVIGDIMTNISKEIFFHTSKIDYLNVLQKKLKAYHYINKSQDMQIDKELNTLDLLSFEKIEDYQACVKELQL